MDIGSLLNQAGGVSAIARQLGVDESTVERGAGALLPHVANGVENQGLPTPAEPQAEAEQGGLGGLLGGLLGGSMGGGGLAGAGGGTGGILGSLIGGGVGNQILGHIFGSKDTSRDVASQASQESGVDTSTLKKLLPIVAGAVAMYYMSHRGQSRAASGAEPQGGGAGAPDGGILGSLLRFQR